ncbi:hypothetical protein [Streptomyces sp. S1]|uniref:hypothetical protein n=1 Tax=Streptomyces sp. S1 TaxID=718288 RepID=UPI003D70DF5D
MKEPTEHQEHEDGRCGADGKKWPCPTWRKWTATPEYRLREVERRLDANRKAGAAVAKELGEAKEKLRRLELLVRGAVLPALGDAGAQISESVEYDHEDYTSWHDTHRVVVRTRADYKVTFVDRAGRVYENGRVLG